MNFKKLLLLLACTFAGFATAGAVDYQYVGTSNAKVTAVSGIGTSAYYLLHGNLGAVVSSAGTPGGFYAGITAKGETADAECVCKLITVTDSTFYVFFPTTGNYWKKPIKWQGGQLTTDKTEAAIVKIKASTTLTGSFTMTYTDDNGKLFYFQDWGNGNNLGAYPPDENKGSVDVDGESDWTIYRADVKQEAAFPLLITKADGIVTPTATSKVFRSRTFYSTDAISAVRFTVDHTVPSDAYNTGSHQGFLFFALAEFGMYDAEGNKIDLTEANFASNATEANEGAIANLCDGDLTNFFHSCWSTHAEPIGGEHYLEVTLPNPVYGFSFEMTARTNFKNFPSEIGITKGGTAFDFYSTYKFQKGDEVTAANIQAGKLYVMRAPVADTFEYPAYALNKRARIDPNVDCMFSLVDAGGGAYYLKYYLRGQYVANPTAAGNLGLVATTSTAGAFTFNADGTISANGYNLYINNEALAAKADTAIAWNIYSAAIDNSEAFAELKTAIDAAQAVVTKYGDKFAANDDGEKAALDAELASANTMYTQQSATSADIITEIDALGKKAAKFRALEILSICDSIDNILMTETFAVEVGAYPVGQSTILTNTSTDARTYFDGGAYTTLTEVEAYIAKVNSVIATFWSSKIVESVMPVYYTTANGLPGKQTEAATQYTWTSPLLFFKEPIAKLRMTVTATNTGDNGAGYYCFALSEFYVYDGDGNPLTLTVDNYATNAQEPSEGPLENICDGNTAVANYFHTRWSAGGAATGDHYLEVTLPSPMYSLSFGYITRNLRTCPTAMTISTGKVVVPDSIGFVLGDTITDVSQLNTTDYYALYGNLNKKAETPTDGSGFYNGRNVTGYEPNRYNLFQLEDAGNGAYRIHFVLSSRYIATPTGWTSAATTYKAGEAGAYVFAPGTNINHAFFIYQDGSFNPQYLNNHYLLQDWGTSSGMGVFPVADFADADVDGESDWTIFKATFTANPDSVKMLGQINRALSISPLEGNNPGYYPSLTSYKAAFNAAVNLRYNGTATSDYVAATTALRNALDNLGDVIKPQAGKTYMFVSAYTEYLKQQGVEKAMYAIDASTVGWMNSLDATIDKAQYYWTIEDATDTTGCFAAKNLLTGTYLGFGATTSAVANMVETPADLDFVAVGSGQFCLKSVAAIKAGCPTGYAYLHTGGHSNGAGASGDIVQWASAVNGASSWYLREVDPSLVELVNKDAAAVSSTTYYTLNGQAVAAPVKGLYIVKTIYANGATKVQKILVK